MPKKRRDPSDSGPGKRLAGRERAPGSDAAVANQREKGTASVRAVVREAMQEIKRNSGPLRSPGRAPREGNC